MALFKKNAGMSEEEYEGATLSTLAQVQREYYEKCSSVLLDVHKACGLVTTGHVTLTLQFPKNKSVRQIRVDLCSTETAVLYQALKEYNKEFGKHAGAQDPRLFDFNPPRASARRPHTSTSCQARAMRTRTPAPPWCTHVALQSLLKRRPHPRKEASQQGRRELCCAATTAW